MLLKKPNYAEIAAIKIRNRYNLTRNGPGPLASP